MRVKDSVATTTCAKMTEEKSKNGGPELEVATGKKSLGPGNANGAKSPNVISNTNADGPQPTSGGSLKFYMGEYIALCCFNSIYYTIRKFQKSPSLAFASIHGFLFVDISKNN